MCPTVINAELHIYTKQGRKCYFNTFNARHIHNYVSDVTSVLFQSSHIHLIDALMMAYIVEMISIEKVVSSVKRFANFSASKELPFDLEDAMVFWINKVRNGTLMFFCVCIRPSLLTCKPFFFVATGERKDEGDRGKRAEN